MGATSVITSVGAGDRFLPYLDRMETSLREHGWEGDLILYRNEYPPGSPTHQELHYGFKYYAVAEAKRRGYKQVLWLDAAIYAVGPVHLLFERIGVDGYLITEEGNILGHWISDQALVHFGVSRDDAMMLRLMGGCTIGLDFQWEVANKFFEGWGGLAQTRLFISAHSKAQPDRMRSLLVSDLDESLIISEDPRCHGHRSDEACLSLLARTLLMRQTRLGDLLVSQSALPWATVVLKGGYDL